ncbi:GBP1 protein, partial [Spizaetus tyrannus]|nr:GBP1 protein [Spizaetus tyrannus]
AVLALAEIENAAAVKEAVTLYQDLMAQRAKLPTENVQELLELHSQCEQEALELFMARAFKDGICHFQADLIVGGPQPSQDSPRDTISPLAFGPGVQGSPCLLPEDSAVPSPELTQSQRLLSHSADWQLSLLRY